MNRELQEDTIYALSTSIGKAAIAIVRVSGQQTAEILRRICPGAAIRERRAILTSICDSSGKVLDRGIVLHFPSPRSFTGEDMIEFQITGSRAVVAELLRSLADIPGTRPADAGEFSRRAFEHGKLDLVKVEALTALVEAETRAQLDHAARMAAGELSQQCEDVRELLLKSLAALEAALDFSDIEDAANMSVTHILPWVKEAHATLVRMMQYSGVSERLRDGMVVVIAGPPNVGKSTLLNYLARRDVAIVSTLPGTTRDSLEVVADVAGFPVTFVDTAGIRETSDQIEALGIARSRMWSNRADLILWVSDEEEPLPRHEFVDRLVFRVRSKADLGGEMPFTSDIIVISAKTGLGIDRLVGRIAEFAREYFVGVGNVTFGNERQRAAARDAQDALQGILHDPARPEELVAEGLRQANHAMSRLTGRIGVEEVLGQIFSHMCVGK